MQKQYSQINQKVRIIVLLGDEKTTVDEVKKNLQLSYQIIPDPDHKLAKFFGFKDPFNGIIIFDYKFKEKHYSVGKKVSEYLSGIKF